MIYINITNFVLISYLEKDHSMIETLCLKNVVIFFQTIYIYSFSGKSSKFHDYMKITFVFHNC